MKSKIIIRRYTKESTCVGLEIENKYKLNGWARCIMGWYPCEEIKASMWDLVLHHQVENIFDIQRRGGTGV